MNVSIIIPNYNHAPYLRKRIDSILNQTFQNFELIILDDCSSDNSREVINEYKSHPKVSHIIYNETNSGTTFKQWERGINLAKGDLIWIAESDDWCEAILLETLVAGFQLNPKCVLGYVQSYTVENENNIAWQSSHTHLKEYLNGKDFINTEMVRRNAVFNASMAIFKKDAFFYVSKDYTTYKFAGDWLFWIEIARQGDVFISGKLLNFFRKHGKHVSSRAYSSGLNFLEDLRILNVLYSSNQISNEMYKTVLAEKNWRYYEKKNSIQNEMRKEIEQLINNTGYKSFLKRDVANRAIKEKIKSSIKKALFIK